ncbi:MAG: response regulator [Deltaproteobacteria bacterium]|jgi:signal transduction histidine kinase/ActR/RegA family two-component response regulator|nr:response regulator [Deltaproteobacteria bacterium]
MTNEDLDIQNFQTSESSELENLQREVNYLRRICESSIGRLLLTDTNAVSIRQELEQKRRGFGLMSDLVSSLRPGSDYVNTFRAVSRRINAALNMQRTAVLLYEQGKSYKVSILQGYEAEQQKELGNKILEVDEELLNPRKVVMVTGADPESRLAQFRHELEIPYFVASPVMLNDEAVAILVTGRLVELPPFLPRLDQSDVETVQTVSAYLAAMLTGQRLEVQEAQKKDLEEIVQTVFQASLDGYTVWDSGTIERISSGALKLFELDNSEEFYRDYQSFGLTEGDLQEAYKRVLKDGMFREERLLRTKSGQLLPCEISHLPLKLHHSTCLLSYIRDLRSQKKNEEALLIAKEQAEVAAKAKSAFLANMSHEIRTPMNAIAGLTHLIYGENLTYKQKGYLDQIGESFNNLLSIVNDVLEFSNISSGKFDLDEIDFYLKDVLDSVITTNWTPAQKKGLELNLKEFDSEQLRLIGDPGHLKQVLNNLVNNAVKFTEKGQVTVSVKNKEKVLIDNGPAEITLEFSVTDTGIGFDDRDTEKLFTAFSQADDSMTRKYGGTGLGLSITRSILEKMGSSLTFQSQPGQGSVFSFTVRLTEAKPKPKPKKEKPKSDRDKAAELASGLKGARILLVEDNEMNQLVAKKIMEKAGIVVTIAENGRQALDKLEEDDFDLVLMDIQMPEMDGLEATRRIRHLPKYNDLPILAMTAHTLREDREQSLKAGMNWHIGKPINLPELFGALAKYITGKEVQLP